MQISYNIKQIINILLIHYCLFIGCPSRIPHGHGNLHFRKGYFRSHIIYYIIFPIYLCTSLRMTENKELRELEEDIEFAKNYLPEALDVKFKVNTNIKFGIVKGDLTLRFLEKALTQARASERQKLCIDLEKAKSLARQEARQECIKEAIEEVLKLEKDIWEGRWFVGHISPFEVKELKDRLTEGKEKEE